MHGENSPEHAPVAKKPESRPGNHRLKPRGSRPTSSARRRRRAQCAEQGRAPLKPRPKQGSNESPRCMGRTALSMPRSRSRQQIRPHRRQRSHQLQPLTRDITPADEARYRAEAEARKQRNPEMHGENSPEHAPVAKPSTDQAAPAPKKPSAPAVDLLGDITPADEARYRAEAEARKQRNPEMHGENSPEHAPVAKKPEQPQPGQSSAQAQGLQTDEFGETTTAAQRAEQRRLRS